MGSKKIKKARGLILFSCIAAALLISWGGAATATLLTFDANLTTGVNLTSAYLLTNAQMPPANPLEPTITSSYIQSLGNLNFVTPGTYQLNIDTGSQTVSSTNLYTIVGVYGISGITAGFSPSQTQPTGSFEANFLQVPESTAYNLVQSGSWASPVTLFNSLPPFPIQESLYNLFFTYNATVGSSLNFYNFSDAALIGTGTISIADIPPAPAPVPEPSAMVLLGSGLAGLVGYGRRRLKKW